MFTRLIALALLVAVAAPAFAQKPESKPAPADLERRLAAMQEMIQQLAKDVQGLRAEVRSLAQPKSPVEKRDDVRIFALKHTNATEMAKTLKGLLQGKDAQQLNIAVDDRTNSVLVTGRPEMQEVIEAIISRLEEMAAKPKGARAAPPGESKGVNWTERLKTLDAEVGVWMDRAEWAKRMAAKGFLPNVQVDVNMKQLDDARAALQKARQEYEKLIGEKKKPMEKDKE